MLKQKANNIVLNTTDLLILIRSTKYIVKYISGDLY